MVSGFLKSSSHNLKYVGIDSLARIVRINAKYAAEHQLAVIDCLEDPDETLKKKTLELLYKMTKPNNVEVRLCCLVPARHWVHGISCKAGYFHARPETSIWSMEAQLFVPAKLGGSRKCSAVSVQVIAEKLLDYLRTTTDDTQKADVAKRIGELAVCYAPDTQWFIDTMNQVSLIR
jgi:hypothetical protein